MDTGIEKLTDAQPKTYTEQPSTLQEAAEKLVRVLNGLRIGQIETKSVGVLGIALSDTQQEADHLLKDIVSARLDDEKRATASNAINTLLKNELGGEKLTLAPRKYEPESVVLLANAIDEKYPNLREPADRFKAFLKDLAEPSLAFPIINFQQLNVRADSDYDRALNAFKIAFYAEHPDLTSNPKTNSASGHVATVEKTRSTHGNIAEAMNAILQNTAEGLQPALWDERNELNKKRELGSPEIPPPIDPANCRIFVQKLARAI